MSYLEIYNEEVRDLLSKNQNVHLEIKERPDVGVYVKDLSTYVVNNAEDMERIMTMGNKNRNRHLAHKDFQSFLFQFLNNFRIGWSDPDEHSQLTFSCYIYRRCRV